MTLEPKSSERCGHKVLNQKGRNNSPLLELAIELEEVALNDPYFIEKNLYPNVIFNSGIIYQALGIPTSMFTVMFAIGRPSDGLLIGGK